MTVSVERALVALRVADPFPPGIKLAQGALPELPGPEIDAEPLQRRRPRQARRIYLPAAAVAIVIAVTAIVLVSRGNDSPAPTATPPVAVSPSPASGSDRARTRLAVTELLAAAPALPRSRQVARLPVLRGHPNGAPVSDNVVDRARFYTARGTMEDAIAYFRAHAAPRFEPDVSGGAYGPSGPQEESLWLVPKGSPFGASTDAYSDLKLVISVAPYHSGIALRVDSEAVWLPSRTRAEHVPAGVTGADVVIDRRGVGPNQQAPDVHRSLAATEARALARLINALGVVPPVMTSCPMDQGFTDVLTFEGARHRIVVTVGVGGCGAVRVVNDGTPQPELEGGTRIDQALMRALGLPRDYGN